MRVKRTNLHYFLSALIQLSRPAILNQRVSLVCLPDQGFIIPDGKQCYATGKCSILIRYLWSKFIFLLKKSVLLKANLPKIWLAHWLGHLYTWVELLWWDMCSKECTYITPTTHTLTLLYISLKQFQAWEVTLENLCLFRLILYFVFNFVGWGLTVPGDWSSQADALKQAMLPKVSQSECLEDNKDAGIPVTNEMFCTGHGGSSPISTCNTDSGGPIVCRDSNGRWYLQGVVSWGSGGCHPGYYSVNARVSKYTKWIYSYTSS